MTGISKIEQCMQVLEANRKIIALKGESLSTSLPIPLQHNGRLLYGMYYFKKFGLPPAPPNIYSPQYQIIFDCTTHEIVDFKTLEQANVVLGVHKLQAGMTVKLFLEKRRELFSLYEEVVALFLANSRGIAPEKAELVRRFYRLFGEVSEAALFRFYQEVNPQFFAWLSLG